MNKFQSVRILPDDFSICRLPPESKCPDLSELSFFSVTRTLEEISIIIPSAVEIEGAKVESGWKALTLVGEIPFDLTGILLELIRPLSGNHIGIFALSTFNTDYVLIKEKHLSLAKQVLEESGYSFLS